MSGFPGFSKESGKSKHKKQRNPNKKSLLFGFRRFNIWISWIKLGLHLDFAVFCLDFAGFHFFFNFLLDFT
jgi:hypothetical protein